MTYNYYQGISNEGLNKPKVAVLAAISAGILALALLAQSVFATQPNTVVVTPSNTQGWNTADTRANGTVSFVADANAPLGAGALSLVTGAATGSPLQDKAQYMHAANVPLADVTSLGYDTKQVSASFVAGLPSYQLPVCLGGIVANTCVGFTTLVYEPYVSEGNAAIQANTWQHWNVGEGKFWSSKSVAPLQASQGTYVYTLDQVRASFPNAVVTDFGVNVGSNNPNWDTRVDAVQFNDTTYDFEVTPYVASTKDECKNGGWMNFQTGYKNQGQCVSSVAKQQ